MIPIHTLLALAIPLLAVDDPTPVTDGPSAVASLVSLVTPWLWPIATAGLSLAGIKWGLPYAVAFFKKLAR